jgi:hypothetical protein
MKTEIKSFGKWPRIIFDSKPPFWNNSKPDIKSAEAGGTLKG